MNVVIKYFSAIRDVTKKVREEVEVSEGVTLSQLLDWFFKTYPEANSFREEILILVNGRVVEGSYQLKNGDEIAVMPPVSGGGVINKPIDIDREVREIIEKTAPSGGGGLVIFVGYVKGSVDGAAVSALDYEAYEPYASEKIREIEKWAKSIGGVLDVRIYHLTGSLKPGDHTLYIFVSADSREVAFRVARETLERVKREVPIFKLERREDGNYWVIGDGRRVKSPQL